MARVCATGGGDARDSTVSVHSVLAAVPDLHHLQRISAQQTRTGQLCPMLSDVNQFSFYKPFFLK